MKRADPQTEARTPGFTVMVADGQAWIPQDQVVWLLTTVANEREHLQRRLQAALDGEASASRALAEWQAGRAPTVSADGYLPRPATPPPVERVTASHPVPGRPDNQRWHGQ